MYASTALCIVLSVVFCGVTAVSEPYPDVALPAYGDSSSKLQEALNLTEADKYFIVERHIEYRGNEGAANMLSMKWNEDLAQLATEWASKCEYKKGHPSLAGKNLPFKKLGQNIMARRGQEDLIWSIDQYYKQKVWYNYTTNSCTGRSCADYKQLIWSNTTDVGCAAAICRGLTPAYKKEDARFFVCYYGPAGNVKGQKPYEKGATCSQCPCNHVCVDKLCFPLPTTTPAPTAPTTRSRCASRGRPCLNGELDEKCICRCSPGWAPGNHGDCSAPCKDTGPCGADSLKVCNVCPMVKRRCPLSCGLCKAVSTETTYHAPVL